MELINAALVGVLMASSVYLMLSRNLVRFVLGLALLSHAANLLIFTGGGITSSITSRAADGATAESDSLAQALILTAIVISFSLFTFALVLAFRTYETLETVDTDAMRAAEPEPSGHPGRTDPSGRPS